MLAYCPEDVHYRHLFDAWTNKPCNPHPIDAEEHLSLPEIFTSAVAKCWDDGIFYGDSTNEDFNVEFSGFLISLPLRHWTPQLTAG